MEKNNCPLFSYTLYKARWKSESSVFHSLLAIFPVSNATISSFQPSEFMTAFSICCHGAAINKNQDGKILLTLFFMLMKTIKCKGKTES